MWGETLEEKTVDLQKIEGVTRKPPRKEKMERADKEAVYRLVACQGVGIFIAARRRNISVTDAAEALLEISREREMAAWRRGRLSVTPPHWPSPAKAA